MSKIVQFQIVKDNPSGTSYICLDEHGRLWKGTWILSTNPIKAEFVWNQIPPPPENAEWTEKQSS